MSTRKRKTSSMKSSMSDLDVKDKSYRTLDGDLKETKEGDKLPKPKHHVPPAGIRFSQVTRNNNVLSLYSRRWGRSILFGFVSLLFVVAGFILIWYISGMLSPIKTKPTTNPTISSPNSLEPEQNDTQHLVDNPEEIGKIQNQTDDKIKQSQINDKQAVDFQMTDDDVAPTTLGSFELLQTVRHDRKAFTQGLVLIQDDTNISHHYFMEGTGMKGYSEVRQVDVNSGAVLQRHSLTAEYFGEGITHYNYYPSGFRKDGVMNSSIKPDRRLIQLTWQEQTAFIYELSSTSASNRSLELSVPLHTFMYNTTNNNEGWGITYNADDHIFYVSDGSSMIHIWDADTYQEKKKLQVTFRRHRKTDSQEIDNEPLRHLNELEWDPVSKTILANVWYQNFIVRINPVSGHILTVYNLNELYKNRPASADCLNGIALSANFETTSDEVWVTGKYWPKMFRVKLIESTTPLP